MTSVAHLRGRGRPDRAASRRAESRRGDREEHETRLPAQQPASNPLLLDCVPFHFFQSVPVTDRASNKTHIHAFTHVHTPSRTHTTHLPPVHTFLILSLLLMADAFCSLLFPFSLSVCSSLPFFNILFLSLHMHSASPRCPHLPPSLSPSLPPLPSLSHSLSLHLLASLSSVCAEREAII